MIGVGSRVEVTAQSHLNFVKRTGLVTRVVNGKLAVVKLDEPATVRFAGPPAQQVESIMEAVATLRELPNLLGEPEE